MTAKELAEMLSGRKYGMEITSEEARAAKDAGLVVVYGYSDDNVEFSGAIDEEVGAYEGTTIYLTKDGLLEEPACGIAENIECPYFIQVREKAQTIKAVWHDRGGPCWTFETDIPHETFTVMEDGAPWCIGIVFKLDDVGSMGAQMSGKEVQELIEKHTPKQPAKVNSSGVRYTSEYRCPTCGGAFTGTGIADYCYHCGQRLDWECQIDGKAH